MMRVFLLAVAAQAFSLGAKPEASLIQQAAQMKLGTGTDTVLTLLTNMLSSTQTALSTEQTNLATTLTSCNQETSAFAATIDAEIKEKALAMASMEAFAAREGALTAKVETLKKRSQESEAEYQSQVDASNADLTREYNEAVVEAQVLANALTVLTNKKAMMQTGAGAQTATMSSEMKTRLHDVIAKKTNVVDADTVMLAISESKNSYTSAVGEAGGFGTVVGIVMSLKNSADQRVAQLSVKLEEWNAHNAVQLSLREKMAESDLSQYTSAQADLLTTHTSREGATTEFDRAKTQLAFTQQELAGKEASCNAAKIEHNKVIRKCQDVIQTLHSVMAQLDNTLASSGAMDAGFIQTGSAQPAHAHVQHSFSRVCAMLDRMVQATANKKAEFQRERRQCDIMMTGMVSKLNNYDSKIDAAHHRLNVLNTDIRGGAGSLDDEIESTLPEAVIQLKVGLQTQSNIRKEQSSHNANVIETNQRYIQECTDAITKLKHISGYATGGDDIATIISEIENLRTDAENFISDATENEKGQHENYMDFVGVTNEQISTKMMDIAEARGQRAQAQGDELNIQAELESLMNQHSNLGIDFTNSCDSYGTASFTHENGDYEAAHTTGSCSGATGCDAHANEAACVGAAASNCHWTDTADDGFAAWADAATANNLKVTEWTNVGDNLAFLMGKLSCTQVAR